MSAVNHAAVEAVLRQYTDPYLNQDPVSAGCVRAIDAELAFTRDAAGKIISAVLTQGGLDVVLPRKP